MNMDDPTDKQAYWIRQAQLLDGRLVDIHLHGERIVLVQAHGSNLMPVGDSSKIDVVEANGGLLLPGLWDHHMHLLGTAAAQSSLRCGPPAVNNATELQAALAKKAASLTQHSEHQWIRGVGFHDSVCPMLNRSWLDEVCPAHPVRIQHRSGMMWIYNSMAIQCLGVSDTSFDLPEGVERDNAGKLTGRFYNLDRWLGERLPSVLPPLAELSKQLAAYGITGVTDTGVNNTRQTLSLLQHACTIGELKQRVMLMGNTDLHHVPSSGSDEIWVRRGALKVYLREVDLPDFDDLVNRVSIAHTAGRPVAVHCVTLAELHFALAALDETGVLEGDRIEHASVADDHAIDKMASLGLTVVSQPHFIAERGEQYRQDVPTDEIPLLYRAASFLRAGVPFAAGSDAPYGRLDPWAAMTAAMARSTQNQRLMGEAERLTFDQALTLYTGCPAAPGKVHRVIERGALADLCLLDCDRQVLAQDLSASHVAMTWVAGRRVYDVNSV